ncbi:hypothetical protein E2C01_004027 [Portunus trituberculatus]|uniref:Uncharacterized protein n=1 Tax=Portunus trituberculatus TaxID=210409 RepID=A0A5B7CQ97_PORTR|nr:hypothetical protein [Portunus trituberculatus]
MLSVQLHHNSTVLLAFNLNSLNIRQETRKAAWSGRVVIVPTLAVYPTAHRDALSSPSRLDPLSQPCNTRLQTPSTLSLCSSRYRMCHRVVLYILTP